MMRAALLTCLLLVSACKGRGTEPPDELPPSDPTADQATQIYKAQCAMCHGPEGRGDGPMASRMGTPPRDYSDGTWQASVSNQQIADAIVKGKGAMPPHPDLASKPDVLRALVEKIRAFQR